MELEVYTTNVELQDIPSYTTSITLEGQLLRLSFLWNERIGKRVLSIKNSADECYLQNTILHPNEPFELNSNAVFDDVPYTVTLIKTGDPKRVGNIFNWSKDYILCFSRTVDVGTEKLNVKYGVTLPSTPIVPKPFSPPYNLIVEFKNDETNRLELNWSLDGFVDEQRYYRSETPIDPENLPAPKAILAGDARSYVDTAIELVKSYHVVVGSVKNGVEKLSSEIEVLVDTTWTPESLLTLTTLIADDSIIDSFGRISQITDTSGNTRHAVQTSEDRKPILTSINSQKAMQFDGSDDFLWISDTSYLKAQNFLWVFWVGEPVFKTGYTSVFYAIYRQDGGSKLNFSLNNGKSAFGGRRIVSDSYAEVASTENISARASINFGQRDFTTKTAILFNDGLQTSVNNNVGTAGVADSLELYGGSLGAYVIALDGSRFSEAYIGKLGCVIVGSGILSEVNRQKLEGWAAHKYSLTDNLPIDHPYKILAPTL